MTKPQVQKNNEKIEPRTWSLKGFLQEIKRIDNDMEDRRFAFILGAGASINSNIKGAAALAKEWMEMIYHREHEPMHNNYQNWLASNPLNFKDWEPNNLAKHYPQIFEQCFEGDHDSGYAALEKAIKDGKPSLGYAVLAWILSSTRHRMVITTNFDNLVADAVSIYGGTYPHVIGHESLASYAKPLSRRPIVAKIHRDLFTDPINTCQGTGALQKSWVETLKNIFRFYTPVFIGYGGNDGSLMDFLQDLDTKEISGRPFWCYYAPGGPPNDTIKQLMTKQNGALVPINGFDEFMLQMGKAIGFDRNKQIAEIKKNSEQRIDKIQEQMLSLSKETKDEGVKEILQPQNKERGNWSWLDWVLNIDETNNRKEQGKRYKDAIEALPESYQLLGNYALFLEQEGKFEEAEQYHLRAIEESKQKEANCLSNYAIFLKEQGKLEKAKKYYNLTIELEPNNADILGNYSVFLKEQGEIEESDKYFNKAINIDPKHAHNLGNYALFLTQEGQLEKAQKYYDLAIELEPNHAHNLGNYALFLKRKGDIKESDKYFKQSIELDPNNGDILGGYALLLTEKKLFEKAEYFYNKAIVQDPNHFSNLINYALFLTQKGRLEKAEQYYCRAFEIEPNPSNANAFGNYALFLEKKGELEKADKYFNKAIELEPNDEVFLGNYAIFLKEQEKLKEANEVIQQALAIAPNDEHLLEIRAAIENKFPHLEETA